MKKSLLGVFLFCFIFPFIYILISFMHQFIYDNVNISEKFIASAIFFISYFLVGILFVYKNKKNLITIIISSLVIFIIALFIEPVQIEEGCGITDYCIEYPEY